MTALAVAVVAAEGEGLAFDWRGWFDWVCLFGSVGGRRADYRNRIEIE